MQYQANLEHHADKVDFLCKFLARNYGIKARFLIIVGERGSGKHSALFSTLDLMKKYDAYYNVVVVSGDGQQHTFANGEPNACDKLWILLRRSDDNHTVAFQTEWNENKNYKCLAARFCPGPTIA